MRKHITELTLAGLVMILAVSNIALATSVRALRQSQGALALDAASAELAAITRTTPGEIKLRNIDPEYGPVGTIIHIRGEGFSKDKKNVISLDYGAIDTVSSTDGKELTVALPKYMTIGCTSTGACPTNTWQEIVPRSYALRVSVGSSKSNELTFLVTSHQTSDKVSITTIKPSMGPTGTVVTITGKGFAKRDNVVTFGYHAIKGLASSNGKTIKFVVPKILVYPCTAGTPCPTSMERATFPGLYPVRVTAGKDTSNSVIFTVTATPTPSPKPTPKPTPSATIKPIRLP